MRGSLKRKLFRSLLYGLLFFFLSDNVIYCFFGANWARNRIQDAECLWANEEGVRPSYEDYKVRECVGTDNLRLSFPNSLNSKKKRNILFIGCSNTFGVGVNDNDTFVWRLNEMVPDVAFYNGGVPGYGALRCKMRLKRLIKHRNYEMVLYPVIADHPMREVFPCFRRMDPDAYIMPYTELAQDFRFVEHTVFGLKWWGDSLYQPINMAKKFYISWLSCNVMPHAAMSEIPPIYAQQVNSMALVANCNRARFVILKLEKFDSDTSRFPASEPMFSNHISGVWDVAFPQTITAEYRVGNNPENHPNATVHRRWAENIAAKLKEQGIIKSYRKLDR